MLNTKPANHARRANLLARIAGLTLATSTAVTLNHAAVHQPAALPTAFGTTRLNLAPTPGVIDLAGRRVHTWTEPSPAAEPTTRILLNGDAQLLIAGQRFDAARADIWLQRIAANRYQLFAYLEDARSGAATSPIAARASLLPIEAVIDTTEPIRLAADARLQGPPPANEAADFRAKAASAFAQRLTGTQAKPEPAPEPLPLAPYPADAPRPDRAPRTLADQPTPEPSADQPPARPAPADPTTPTTADPTTADAPPPPDQPTEPAAPAPGGIFTSDGVFFISAGDQIVVAPAQTAAGNENTLQLSGGVVVQYTGREGTLEIAAQRAVVFLTGGRLTDLAGRFSQSDIQGIYLEGDVSASDGQYTLRGPRIYYDVQSGKALVIDAVFWTWDERTAMPLYMRAEAVRQEAANQFTADNAVFSNSAFFTPHLAIGARDLTISRVPNERRPGTERTIVDARHITFRGAGVPFFYLPAFKGDPERIPLRNIGYRDTNRQGAAILTQWDAFTVLGITPPEGLDATVNLDYYSDRGFGLGTNITWDTPTQRGEILAYYLPDDNGTDVTGLGREIDQQGDARGLFLLNQRWQIAPDWTLTGELAFISDPLLTVDLFEDIAVFTPNELTNRLHLRRLDEQSMLTIEAKAMANDFFANEFLLQAPGYTVDKLPEIEYWNVATDVLPETAPGLLTHTWEASLASMRLRFSEVPIDEQGFFGTNSNRLFGVTDTTQSLGDTLRATGLNESIVNRFDTRQELAATLDAGPLRINPFIVGRFTAYDDSFADFSPLEDESVRTWGAAGVRFSTSLNRIDNNADSRTFDVHRIRHIIEPSLTLWHAESTVERQDLPVYDDDVESLAEGSMARVGIDQTWQTKRGGVGRWRNVDLLKLNLGYVWAGDNNERGTPIGRWYDARPELGSPQQYAHAEFVWQTSEIVALTGEMTYDPFDSAADYAAIGIIFDRGRGFDMRAELRRIESQDATFGDIGVGYLLSDKYDLDLITQYDFTREDFSLITATLLRAFPYGQLGAVIQYDNIRSTTSLGLVFRPRGVLGGLNVGGGQNRDSGFGG